MESRKMVLMKLLAGKNVDADIDNWLVDTVGKERAEQMQKAAQTHIHYHV